MAYDLSNSNWTLRNTARSPCSTMAAKAEGVRALARLQRAYRRVGGGVKARSSRLTREATLRRRRQPQPHARLPLDQLDQVGKVALPQPSTDRGGERLRDLRRDRDGD